MIWLVVILFGFLTILFLSGKGAFLIAGYNTAGKAEKMKYDKKKLCRVTGGGMGIITLLLAIMGFFGDNPPGWLVTLSLFGVLLSIAAILILSNTICQSKNPAAAEETKEGKKRCSKTKRLSLAVTLIFLSGIGIVMITGEIKVSTDEKNVIIQGSYWKDLQLPIEQIQSISYTEDFITGRRTGGFGSLKLLEGNFHNKTFGSYTLYAYSRCSNFIILQTQNRKIVVNASTPEETKSLYHMLENAISK